MTGVDIGIKLKTKKTVPNIVKYVWFEKRSIKEFNFNGIIENNGEWARVGCSTVVDDKYSRDVSGYNIITDENCQFVPKTQTEFSSYNGNMIGLHSGGTIQLKVSKAEVEASGRVYDVAGILDYVNKMKSFNIYIKLKTKKAEDFNLTIPVKKGDVVN